MNQNNLIYQFNEKAKIKLLFNRVANSACIKESDLDAKLIKYLDVPEYMIIMN